MMRKKIVSLCMALALCLGLLPVTALAADGIELYVGGQLITESGCYEKNQDGNWTKVGNAEPASGQFYYDAATATLTLNQAKIVNNQDVTVGGGFTYPGSVIAFSQSADVPLTIVVSQGRSTITGKGGIRVESTTGNASLSIKGPGSLDVKPIGSNSGITLSSSKNRNLDIDGADVTASSPALYGVYLFSSTDASSTSTITVNNGSLTTGGNGNVGIYYYWSGTSNAGTSSLTVSGNAVVDTRNSQIMANKETVVQVGAGSDGNGGIVFNGKSGTVYGDVTLDESLTIGSEETLTIPDDSSLISNGNLTNNGKIIVDNGGKLEGTINGNQPPKITTERLNDGTVNTKYNQTLVASGDATITWSSSNLPNWLTLNSDGTISGTPTAAGTSTFTVKAENTAGSDRKELTLTINPAPVLVTGVTLDQAELALYTGQSETLTATVTPNDATNPNVTWSSDNPSVATVNNGVVSAVSEGTATITVAAQSDNTKSATCTVTVTRPYIPPANPNYRIDVTTTEGGTVAKDPAAAKAGETVTLTPTPEEGYEVGEVTVADRFGDAVAVTENPDGTYTFTMPNGQVKVAVTFVEATPEPLPFTDVAEGDWFHDAVRYAYDNGLMDGVGDNLFAPNSETTRAQLVTILYRLAGQPAVSGDLPFTDVESGTWYTDAILWAAQNNIVNGVNDTEFAPGDDLTRQQLVTILYRYAESKGYDVSASADLSGYPDADQVQDYAQPAMAWAVAEGIVEGVDGTLNPAGNASRAQIATILMRFLAAVPTE